jgi:nitrogen fixation NifU-like protein
VSSPYGAVVLEHFRRPRHRGALVAPDASAEAFNPLCGDRVRVELRIEPAPGEARVAGARIDGARIDGARIDGARIAEARFVGDACAIGVAAASLLMERVAGAPLDDAERVSLDELVALLGAGVPAARLACARLPLDALRAGASAYRARLARAAG